MNQVSLFLCQDSDQLSSENSYNIDPTEFIFLWLGLDRNFEESLYPIHDWYKVTCRENLVFSRSFQNLFSFPFIPSQCKKQTHCLTSVFLIWLLFFSPMYIGQTLENNFFFIYPLPFSHTYTTPVYSWEVCLINPFTSFSCNFHYHPSGLLQQFSNISLPSVSAPSDPFYSLSTN